MIETSEQELRRQANELKESNLHGQPLKEAGEALEKAIDKAVGDRDKQAKAAAEASKKPSKPSVVTTSSVSKK